MEQAAALVSTDDFDARYPRLFVSLTRLARALGAGDEAEDLAQEVLLQGRARLPGLRDPAKLEPWLRRIMVRSASRHRGRRRASESDLEPVYVPTDPAGLLDISVAIAGLPERERIAVTLVYGLGYTQETAADAMGISRGGVASTLFKARVRLVRDLGGTRRLREIE